MSADEPPDEQYSALFAAGEEALVLGEPAATVQLSAAPPELRPRLEHDLACVRLLHQLLGPPADGTTVGKSRRLGFTRVRIRLSLTDFSKCR
jgi:hypothetical protein